MKFYKSSIFFTFLISIFGCDKYDHLHRDVILNSTDVLKLKKSYTPEVFNYFYETVFYDDRLQTRLNVTEKWEKNIKLIVKGYPDSIENRVVSDIVSLINSLNIKVQISFVEDEDKANYNFFFGSKTELDSIFELTTSTAGVVKSVSSHGRIKNIGLGIIRNDDTSYPKRKRAVILEEMIQSLGLGGDSFSYPNSIFYEGRNFQDEFIGLDRQVLQLLYDPLMPANYSREKFEADFADVLYSINTFEKLKKYFQEQGTPVALLEKMKNYCFTDSNFYRHPRTVDLYIYGDYSTEDSIHVQKNILAINEISDYLQLNLRPFENYYPTSGIILNYKNKQDQEYTVFSEIRSKNGKAMFPKRVMNEVDIYYKNGKNGQQKKNRTVTEILFKCLGPIKIESLDGLFTEENGKIHFGNEYHQMLKVYYRPEFADGFTLQEFEQLITELSASEI